MSIRKWLLLGLCVITMALSGCKSDSKAGELKFATSAEYPPFEYKVNGALRGFDKHTRVPQETLELD